MKSVLAALICLGIFGCAQKKEPSGSNAFKALSSNAREGIADCSETFNSSRLCLSFTWVKFPTETDFGEFTFKTYRQNLLDQSPVQVDLPSLPDVILWMPSMGHGSSPVSVERIDIGTYRATQVFFIMPGEWQIKWQVKQGLAVEDEAIISLTL